ncbi:hypothetical protein [Pragia fontium]|uniref:Uncharacterized protein n=2 Tax=Pragia fontium TaxID=82985 RepID=A0AAJ4W9Y7_9GAMM|nr:hypothetical protein [Pragia fontium]AKJ43155.1 hypothetical protein QQ39_14670 [Pragia fontium]SFC64631.1 hypothetical protein SAMN02745723_103200 [Pragia fontium DSM 5563 = ATCC 49100]SUB83608.1 Uncharacterised protein [Pragia fontium]VEJ56513.1 Uncharacterised protein [Pragia fontium]GKX63452.1 hypothetical protein SOASR032_20210 [Pragia fontium]
MANKIVENIISSIELITDPWIDSQLHDFYHNDENVVEFSYELIDNKYYISVMLKQPDIHTIKIHFMSLVSLMQYSYFTFYSRKANEHLVSYKLISGGSDMKGFYCEINYGHI